MFTAPEICIKTIISILIDRCVKYIIIRIREGFMEKDSYSETHINSNINYVKGRNTAIYDCIVMIQQSERIDDSP